MCYILVTKRPLTQIEIAAVERHARANRDGAGFAVVEDGKVIVRKGLWSEELVSQTLAKLQEPGDHWRMVHYRTATSGSVVPELAHPFKTKHGAFAFNGHVGDDLCITMSLVLASRGVTITRPVSDALLMALTISHLGWAAAVPIIERGGRGVLLTLKGPRFAGYWHADGNELYSSAPLSASSGFPLDCMECGRVSICDICDGQLAGLKVTIPGTRPFKRRCGEDVNCLVGGHSLLDVCETAFEHCLLEGDYIDDEDDELEIRPIRNNQSGCVAECDRITVCAICHINPRSVRAIANLPTLLPYQRCVIKGAYCQFLGHTAKSLCSHQIGDSKICVWAALMNGEDEDDTPEVD